MTLLKPGLDLGERQRVPHPHFSIVFASPVRVEESQEGQVPIQKVNWGNEKAATAT